MKTSILPIFQRLLFSILFCLIFSAGYAQQYAIGGPRCVFPGTAYPYSINGTGARSIGDRWCVTGGTINGSSCFTTTTTSNTVNIVWNQATPGTITYYHPSATAVATYTVDVQVTIVQPSADPEIPYPWVPMNTLAPVHLIASPLTGCPFNILWVQWQKSTDGGTTWVDIPLANGSSYKTLESFSVQTQIRRKHYIGAEGNPTPNHTAISSPFTIRVSTPIIAPDISPANTLVKANSTISVTFSRSGNASGGTMCSGNYIYTWQTSTDNNNWVNAGTGTNLTVTTVPRKTYVRQKIECGPLRGYTKSAVIDVHKPLHAGMISPGQITILPGANPGTITGSPASNGNTPAGYTYEWQVSTDNGVNYTAIGSTNVLNYLPGIISANRVFRRKVTCDGEVAYTDPVKILTDNALSATNQNFIRTRELNRPVTTETAANALTSPRDVKEVTSYMDDIGQPQMSVVKLGSLATGSTPTDLVQLTLSDAAGRKSFQYLPYASAETNGLYKLNALSETNSFYATNFSGEDYHYSRTEYEKNPIGRITSAYSAGKNWAGNNRGVQSVYLTNTLRDEVRMWVVTPGTLGSFSTYEAVNCYQEGTLGKLITTGEDGKQIIEFKDRDGAVVLKKIQVTGAPDDGSGTGHAGWVSNYYIRDIYGNLVCMIQPKGVELLIENNWDINALSGLILNEQCFRYAYDHRNRVIIKKTPGAGEARVVYDARDRMVLTQDANMRETSQKKWMYLLYDAANRIVETGSITDAANYNNHAFHLNEAKASTAYPNLVNYPSNELFSKTGYDNYTTLPVASGLNGTYDNTYKTAAYMNTAYGQAPEYAEEPVAATSVKGLMTWTMLKKLDNGAAAYTYVIYIYDASGRVIQTKSINVTGGTNIESNQYSWNGALLRKVEKVTKGTSTPVSNILLTIQQYDDLWRLSAIQTKVTHPAVNGGALPAQAITTATYQYNKLGQMINRKLGNKPGTSGGASPLAVQAYEYNIRGWLISINKGYLSRSNNQDEYFAMALGYDNAGTWSFAKQQYNGTVAGQVWKSTGDGVVRKYDYDYDAMGRLMKADFTDSKGFNFNMKMGDGVDPLLAYDANGNILRMQHWGIKAAASAQLDDLRYTYQTGSNKLKNVKDVMNDPNGKMGDFKTSALHPQFSAKNAATTSTELEAITDYSYDANGNLVKDLNKDITTAGGGNGITYNHLGLAASVVVRKDASSEKGNIAYTYDAAGAKLQKITVENMPGKTVTTTTWYLGSFVYQARVTSPAATDDYTDRLIFALHDEGRVRFTAAAGSNPAKMDYDYFLKDQLGNTRGVVTEEVKYDQYETLALDGNSGQLAAQSQYWENASGLPLNVSSVRIVWPTSFRSTYGDAGPNGLYAMALKKSTGAVGAAKLLKVMAGDKIHTKVDYYYEAANYNNTASNGLNTLGAVLLNALNTNGAVANSIKGSASSVASGATGDPGVISLFGPQGAGGATDVKPKAFLNILFFDDQFKFDASLSQCVPVSQNPNLIGSIDKMGANAISVTKGGYIFVYFSNESETLVYFDNFRLTHDRGPILEETHYYPFGLTMAGISSKATGRTENGYKFNEGTELNNDLDISLYETIFRGYDPQIGRFIQPDPLSEYFNFSSPYAFAFNNPISLNDPWGSDPPEFNTVEELLDYVQKNGLSSFPDGFMQWTFGEDGEVESFTYDPNPRIGENKNGDKGIWVNYSFSINNGEVISFREVILGEVVVGLRFIKATDLKEMWNDYEDYLDREFGRKVWKISSAPVKIGLGAWGASTYLKVTKNIGWWRGINGKYNKLKWGGNQYTGPRSAAKSLAGKIGLAGKVLGGIGVVVSGAQAIDDFRHGNNAAGVLHTVDAVMGVVGLCGPAGAIVSGAYFVGRFAVSWFSDDDDE